MIFQRELRRILADPHLADEERRRAITRLTDDLIGADRGVSAADTPAVVYARGYNAAKEEARERLYR